MFRIKFLRILKVRMSGSDVFCVGLVLVFELGGVKVLVIDLLIVLDVFVMISWRICLVFVGVM